MRIRKAWLLGVAGIVWAITGARPAAADPWLSLHPLTVSSPVRTATGGWVLDETDLDQDPLLGAMVTTPTVWAIGEGASERTLTIGFGAPIWSQRFTLQFQAARDRDQVVRERLQAQTGALDPTGSPDSLRVLQTRQQAQDPESFRRIGIRTGIHSERISLAMFLVVSDDERKPGTGRFAFPTTQVVFGAGGALAEDQFDLDSGALVLSRDLTLDSDLEEKRVEGGGEVSVRFGSVHVGGSFVWERERQRDRFEARDVGSVGDLSGAVVGNRQLTRRQNRWRTTLRVGGDHGDAADGGSWLWTGGLRFGKAGSAEWRGFESLETQSDQGGNRRLIDEWVREPFLRGDPDETEVVLQGGIGYRRVMDRVRYGLGVDANWRQRTRDFTFRERLVRRVDDPGIPGQRPASFLEAEGFGDWRVDQEETRARAAMSLGGRVEVHRAVQALVGGVVGWRRRDLEFAQTLVDSESVTGERETATNVIDPVSIPFAEFDRQRREEIKRDETFYRTHLGLEIGWAQARIGTLFTWEDLDHVGLRLQGAFTW